MHPSVGTQLNYSVTSWKWGKDMIELKLDNGKIVQINPAYVIALIHAEVEEEEALHHSVTKGRSTWVEHEGAATEQGTDNER